jgi:hypothetical protein
MSSLDLAYYSFVAKAPNHARDCVKSPKSREVRDGFQELTKIYQRLTKAHRSFHAVSRFSQPVPASRLVAGPTSLLTCARHEGFEDTCVLGLWGERVEAEGSGEQGELAGVEAFFLTVGQEDTGSAFDAGKNDKPTEYFAGAPRELFSQVRCRHYRTRDRSATKRPNCSARWGVGFDVNRVEVVAQAQQYLAGRDRRERPISAQELKSLNGWGILPRP